MNHFFINYPIVSIFKQACQVLTQTQVTLWNFGKLSLANQAHTMVKDSNDPWYIGQNRNKKYIRDLLVSISTK